MKNSNYDIRLVAPMLVATHNSRGCVALVAPSHEWSLAMGKSIPSRVVAIVSQNGIMSLATVTGDIIYSGVKARAYHQWNMICEAGSRILEHSGMGGYALWKDMAFRCNVARAQPTGMFFQKLEQPSCLFTILNSLQHIAFQSQLVASSLLSVLGNCEFVEFPPDRSPYYWEFFL